MSTEENRDITYEPGKGWTRTASEELPPSLCQVFVFDHKIEVAHNLISASLADYAGNGHIPLGTRFLRLMLAEEVIGLLKEANALLGKLIKANNTRGMDDEARRITARLEKLIEDEIAPLIVEMTTIQGEKTN